MIPAGALSLLLGLRRRDGSAAVSAAWFALLASVGPLVWMLRDRAVDGSLMGARDPSNVSARTTVESFMSVLGSWLLPQGSWRHLQKPIGAGIVLLAAGALAVLVITRRRRSRPVGAPSLVPLVVFVGVYSIYVVASESSTFVDVPNDRLLSPLYVPLLVLAAVIIDRVAALIPVRLQRSFVIAVTVVLTGLVLTQAWSSTRRARSAANHGVGYTSRAWQRSPLAVAAARTPGAALLYSNDPRGLWAVIKRQPILLSPAKSGFRLATLTVTGIRSFERATRCRNAYLAWYTTSPPLLLTPRELQRVARLVPAGSFADGQLYRIEPADTRRPRCSPRR